MDGQTEVRPAVTYFTKDANPNGGNLVDGTGYLSAEDTVSPDSDAANWKMWTRTLALSRATTARDAV